MGYVDAIGVVLLNGRGEIWKSMSISFRSTASERCESMD